MIAKLLQLVVGIMVICLGVYLFKHADIGSVDDQVGPIVIRVLTVLLMLLGVFSILFTLFPDRIQRIMFGSPNRRFY